MEYRRLGRSGLLVSPICLGAMMFGERTDQAEAARIVASAREAGVNFIDTADVYSAGESEEIVGKALNGRRDDVVLATKVGWAFDDDPNHRGGSRRWIIRQVENSLRRLQTDHIDLYQLHRLDPHTDVDETLSALSDLVAQGKVRAIGSSTFFASEIVEAQWVARERDLQRFATEQPPTRCSPARSSSTSCPHRPTSRHGHPHLQPAGRRLAVGQLDRRQLPQHTGTQAPRRPLRHEPARQPAQARRRPATRPGRRRRRRLDDRAGHRAFVANHPAVTSAIIGPRTMEQLESHLLPPMSRSAPTCLTASTRSSRPASRSTPPTTATASTPSSRTCAAADFGANLTAARASLRFP